MKFTHCEIEGLVIIDPKVFGDSRGYFFENYNREQFSNAGLNMTFVQDNQSFSGKGILRGLHFQTPPHAQGKLVRVVRGAIFDVAVDIRPYSSTYGQSKALILSGENKRMFYIPEGFAHGFYTLEPDTIVQYKCTGLYAPGSEGGLMWNDPDLHIEWPLDMEPVLSEKDRNYPRFREFVSPF